jgi:2-C-methyl-D-erythritol 2,4-cyclodiphosphate synthase
LMAKQGHVEWRVGIGHDTHRLVAGRPLILGGVTIDYSRGLLGHSDADVVMHAVADALLGAVALGDIGEHFPDTEPQWAGIAGSDLLERIRILVSDSGWVASNVDLTIHAQAPKLSLYKAEMEARIAAILGLTNADVNVKAKTGESVGPVGRGEIIGCDAIVMVRRIPDCETD